MVLYRSFVAVLMKGFFFFFCYNPEFLCKTAVYEVFPSLIGIVCRFYTSYAKTRSGLGSPPTGSLSRQCHGWRFPCFSIPKKC